jgi:hypothetical protein
VGGMAGTDSFFLLRTAAVSSVPTESSHTAKAAMLGQFNCRGSCTRTARGLRDAKDGVARDFHGPAPGIGPAPTSGMRIRKPRSGKESSFTPIFILANVNSSSTGILTSLFIHFRR